MAQVAYSVIDVILGEAGGATSAERFADMMNIASVIANRAAQTGDTPEDIIAGDGQFDAYGKNLPPGVENLRQQAQQAWEQVQRSGPIHEGTFFATPARVDRLTRTGLTPLETVSPVEGGHVILTDPQARPIITANGVRPVREAAPALPDSPPVPTSRTEGLAQGLQMMAPGGMGGLKAPESLARPGKFGGNVFQDKEYQNFTGGLGKPLGTAPVDPYSGGVEKFFGRPVSTGTAGPDSQSTREIIPGLGLGNLAPPVPEMAGEQPNPFGPPGGVDFNLGPMRPYMPNQPVVDIARSALDYVYGPDYKMEVFSGKGTGTGSNRHPTGNAIDARFYTPDGRRLDATQDRDGMLAIAQAAAAKGALGTGLGTNYMGGVGMHIDTVKPGRGQDHEWGNIGDANAGLLADARTRGQMPLPMRMAPPPSKPAAMAAPVGQVERSPLSPIPALALPPEGMARGVMAGLGPTVNNRPPLPSIFAARPGAIAPTAVRTGGAGVVDQTLPELAGRSAPRSPRGRTAAPVRLDNPISVGQPGGKYGGTGLSAMMGVRSGMSPVGTVARSASNPDVMAVSLPHGNVAHVNTGKGFISTWSPADDDERGTVYGKVVAIDPTGSKYGYYSPGKAPKGWTTYGPETSPGPGKGFSKSASRSGPSERSGLAGFLSGIFGGQQSRGPASSGFGMGRGGILGLPGPLGLAAGMFGPAGGMGGLGLGGGFGGGPAGGGFGGYGNPGFGGAISSNNNYGGL